MSTEKERKKLATRLQSVFEGIYHLKDAHGRPISETFQRLPLRTGTDYYKIIKNPVSLHGVGRSIKKHFYTRAQDFINQLVQITWNARVYNVKSSIIYEHALILNQYIIDKIIPKLSNEKNVPDSRYLHYPDLGPLPEDDSSALSYRNNQQFTSEGHEDEEEDGDDGDADEEDYNEYGSNVNASIRNSVYAQPNDQHYQALLANNTLTNRLHLKTSPSPYQSHHATKQESGIRRGRPPIIDKPYETRIKLILKHFKKLRHPNDPNHPLTFYFDRLLDPKTYGNYYQVIRHPISLNEIRAKVRARKYHTVDEFIGDLNLMFQNTKMYFANDQLNSMYQDCLLFEAEANNIINYELSRPEKELLVANTPGGDGIIRIPLDSIEINGHTYVIGDWVLINNASDPERPTVGQIFRLWATEDGTKYTNVCWYYRPEQTCHRYDRLFFMNEVCKTGQYRDHLASEIVGPCYVIFLTRYQKGDLPEGVIAEGCPWFICEFRYNENSHVFNRIRTWKACLPDEIRDKPEQPLIPLNEPRRLIKYESPIKGLLPDGVDTSMPIPDATPGIHPNTPPIVGSVYLREPVEDDELGQYSTSPNVVPSIENDDPVSGRKAYIFTPVSQLKMVGTYPSSFSNNTSGLNTPVYHNQTSHDTDGDRSYISSVNRYRQLLQQQQQQQQQLQYEKSKIEPRRGITPTASGGAQANSLVATYHTSTSTYSNMLTGGILSYTTIDENSLADISESLNQKRRKIDEETSQCEIVWYRAPPLNLSRKILNNNVTELGHSAKYLAWKLGHS
ncbi:Piso0_002863 [Millerozyma farinosa CBS 7064]|uniref:Piso0_002863 protein n=1 Tax=Pichia sorbitophila (strain ATCC MYA-4447 / BCRC 22081 / CBS 7064 / NBRC 10061 / NRRL Y-12695) TaxID=559304 RepID=G8YG65_PICSO|nr:Piso0_002863 [Millerozyma farinosa CBS 7064]